MPASNAGRMCYVDREDIFLKHLNIMSESLVQLASAVEDIANILEEMNKRQQAGELQIQVAEFDDGTERSRHNR